MANTSLQPITIQYRGVDAQEEAENLGRALATADVTVEAAPSPPEKDVRLGAAEIIITFVASAALKTAAELALRQLEAFFRQRAAQARGNPTDVKVQVVVKPDENAVPARFPAKLNDLKNDAVLVFIDKIRAAISKL